MRVAILGLAAGVLLLQQCAELPDPRLLGALALLAALVFLPAFAWRPLRQALARRLAPAASARRAVLALCAGFFLGYLWSAAFAHWRLADGLDPGLEGRDVVVIGVIASLPQPYERGVRFEFETEAAPDGVPGRVLLSWYNGLAPEEFQEVRPVRAGERWRFTVRLRRPHGNLNPHGFDYEAWLLERGLRASGYVVPRGGAQRLSPFVWRPGHVIERMREGVRERFWDALPEARYAGVLVALAIGDQRAIEPEEWQVFARTGVSHLMSISGLHVTMVSGLFAALVMAAWRRSERLVLALPAKKAAALAGFLAALAYCLISGFAVPAQRTLYMIGAVALCLWLGRTSSASRVLALALAVVLLADPWAVLSPGYWLSFGAVGVILFVVSGRTLRAHWLVEWGKVQWAVTLGLTPLLLLLFQQVSLISPVANAVAIPLVSLVVTPLALLGAVLPVELPLRLAHLLLEGLMPVLDWLARLEGAVWQQHAPVPWTLPFACLGVLWLLLPRGFPARWLGVPLLVPLIAVAPSGPGPGELWITVFDVGQGLAVLARTERHTLLYDTGPRFNAFADSGSRVIFPYLRGEGIARLDALVISHDDNDHAGGALSVLASLPVDALWSSLPRQHPLLELSPLRLPCRAGQGWTWDGVRFGFLHPGEQGIEDALRPGNDRSCVLRISNEAGSLLLTGDIEWRAERELLQKFSAELSADALIVPHHGSTTSSTEEFVERVGARYAVFAAGYRNRFGHPREEVLARYRRRGSAILRTDETGAVHMRFTREGIAIERERERARRYWHSPSAGS